MAGLLAAQFIDKVEVVMTLYESCVVIICDHPNCRAEVVAAGGGEARALARACGWRERERPLWIDPLFLCPAHKDWTPSP